MPTSRPTPAPVTSLSALSPLDGRYADAVSPLNEHLSEGALNRHRVAVELAWLKHLAATGDVPGLRNVTEIETGILCDLAASIDADALAEIAQIEAETKHDVKAVEYFIKRRLEPTSLADITEYVHVFCTSEDINNLAYARMIRDAITQVWLPVAHDLVHDLTTLARTHAALPMLARTHGQPATPTTVGKELAVFSYRLQRVLNRVLAAEYLGKMNGATGTYSAHVVAAPDADWPAISKSFVQQLGLTWNPLTTQIESHDWQAQLYADIRLFNRIVHNLCTDLWGYISLGYFVQVRGQGTVGSSTMPHKVNPIKFENAEANIEVSNALLGVLADELVTSRWQRDLTDSSLQRNVGIALGHSLLALHNTRSGLAGLDVDPDALADDLDATWEVLGEAVQSVMRVHGLPEPYERLKELTRGQQLTAERLHAFIQTLELPDAVRSDVLALTPGTYTGIAESLVAYLD